MYTLLIVFLKEVRDNFRDRRSLLSALLMGPLLGPILIVSVINLSIERSVDNFERAIKVPVVGKEHAPTLISYLSGRKIEVIDGPDNRDAAFSAIKNGTHNVVVVIPETFVEQFETTTPARVELITDNANSLATKDARRVRNALGAYSREIATMRLIARGISPQVLRPINVDSVDISTPSGRSAIMLGMLSYFLLFALLMGGMYLAIDTTAGERERGSLEPLLTLPVKRSQLILGKIAAACLFMILSLSLCLMSLSVALTFVSFDQLGMTPNFGLDVIAKAFLVLLPFVMLGAALLTLVASFTKSYKEAQTWLSMVLIAPTLPILIVSLLEIRPKLELMLIPSLSQHMILIDMIKDEPLNPAYIATSVLSTLACAVIVSWFCVRLYKREGLLA